MATDLSSLRTVYYEQPPFIYKDENGDLKGMIIDISRRAKYYCDVEFQFEVNAKTAKNFSSIFSDPEYEHIRRDDYMWLSLTSYFSKDFLTKNDMQSATFIDSPGIEVLMHREQIGVRTKIWIGIYQCRHLFVIGCILVVVFGSLIWCVERWKNPEFEKCFAGAGTGIWMGLVTMTTVGYGDVTPKSIFGRIISMVWMLIGLLISAILTSTMTTAFTGLDHLDIYQQKVVAKNGSIEAWIAKNAYKAQVIEVSEYPQLFEMVQSRKVAGLTNTDVLLYYQEDVRKKKIRVVKHLVEKIPISFFYPDTKENGDYHPGLDGFINSCLSYAEYWNAVVDNSVHAYRGYTKVDTLDMDEPLGEFMLNNITFLILAIIAAIIIVLGLMSEVVYHIRKYMKKKGSTGYDVENLGHENLGKDQLAHEQFRRKSFVNMGKDSHVELLIEGLEKKLDRKLEIILEKLRKDVDD